MKSKMRLLLLLPLLMGSCISSYVASNKASDFEGKLEKVYIILRGSESANGFFYSFRDEFGKHLKTKGVKYAFKVLDPLALETEEQMMAKISEFDPQYVMMIVQTEARSTTNGYGWNNSLNVGGTFDVQLRDLSGEKILWRASLKTDGGWGIETSVYKAAQKLFDRMVEDRLFN